MNHPIIQSVLPGDVVFDIGAHAGDKADWFLSRGAHVICVEPQPNMIQILKNRFSGRERVEVVGKAVGKQVGELPMSICEKSPAISTLSEEWKKGRFSAETWESIVTVPVTTMDDLVLEYGIPRYTKVDVEGFEKQVFSGLSRRVGIVSFEFTAEYIADAFEVVGQLIKLGYGKFNLSLGESSEFSLLEWVPFQDLVVILSVNVQQHPNLWGDIYAN